MPSAKQHLPGAVAALMGWDAAFRALSPQLSSGTMACQQPCRGRAEADERIVIRQRAEIVDDR